MKTLKIIVATVCMGLMPLCIRAQADTVKAKILDDGSQDAEKAYNNGITNFSAKNYSAALKDFDQAVALKPDFERAWFNKGTTKFELKDYTGAIADFNKAIEIKETEDVFFGRAQ